MAGGSLLGVRNTMSVTTTNPATQVAREEMIRVLRSSLYPGAKTESIELVLSYCRVNGLDPMLKPVHIVPTSVKRPDGSWEKVDVLMPGIADYRIKAARSGEYLGKTEPMFGPVKTEKLDGVTVTYPEWCKITVARLVAGQRAEFTATEYWLENYATAKRDSAAPNAMWQKRGFGQLAKCTEAQALRQAFPEFSGGAVTAEEMEGKTLEGVAVPAAAEPTVDRAREKAEALAARFREVKTAGDYYALLDEQSTQTAFTWLKANRPDLYELVDVARSTASTTMQDVPDAAEVEGQ